MNDARTGPAATGRAEDPLLSVRDLAVHFPTPGGTIRAVDGVSFDVRRGETVCLVGESGSGKTVTCEALTRLVAPSARIDGAVYLDGDDLLDVTDDALTDVRGRRVAYIFQNPQDALDPVYTVGAQVAEAVRIHRDVSKTAARERAVDLLGRVGIPDPDDRADDYPYQFSGGMRQRVVIAAALAADPDLLVADEPTTALDVTIQAQILRLLRDLQRDRDLAVLFITHDLGVVAQVADRAVVMYAGKVMERASVHELFADPAHPYTRALLGSLPGRDRDATSIPGELPDPRDPPDGCRFQPRCPHAVEACRRGDQPPLLETGVTGDAACVYFGPDFDAARLDEPARDGAHPGADTGDDPTGDGSEDRPGDGGDRPSDGGDDPAGDGDDARRDRRRHDRGDDDG